MSNGPLCMPDFGAAEDFEFPDRGPATAAQIRNLEALIANYLREVMARQFPEVSAGTLGVAWGVDTRRAQQVAAEARKRGHSATAEAALELLHGMFAGKLPTVLRTPKNKETQWIFQHVGYFDGDDWRELEHLSEAGMDLFRTMHAAFQRDRLKWLGSER